MGSEEKNTRVPIRLTDDTKEQWAQKADEEGFGSVAAMVRTAVTKHFFASDYPEQGSAEAVNVDLSNLETELSQLHSKVDSIDRQLSDLQDDPDTTGLGDDLQEVEDDLMDILPTVTHPSQLPRRTEIDYEQHRWDIAAEGGFLDDIIDAVPHGEFDVRATIDSMKEDTPVVEVLSETGTQVCWAVEFDSDYYEREGVTKDE